MNKNQSGSAFGMAAESTRKFVRYARPGAEDETVIEDDDTIENQEPESEARIKALEQQQALNQLLADPEVAAVLKARQEGRKVSIVDAKDEEGETAPEPEEDPLKDLPADDPKKELLTSILGLIDKKLSPILRKIETAEQTFGQRLENVEGVSDTIKKREVDDQIRAAKAKYKDLPQYSAKMMELVKAHPTLNVEQLYLIAKQTAGKLRLAAEPTTFSERPTQQPPRRPGGKGPNKPPERSAGRKGFGEILADSLSTLSITDEE